MAESHLDANKKQIVEYIIKNSPYGETAEVIQDLKKLISDYSQYEEFVKELLINHANDHFAIAKGYSENPSFLLTPVNYQDGYYLDQANNKKVFVDHSTLTVVSTEDAELEQSKQMSQYRVAIEKGLQDYLRSYFAGTQSGFLVHVDSDGSNNSIYIIISCKNLHLNNYHGGEWISDWIIDSNSLIGKIRINSHFFEDGNVCLKEVKKVEVDKVKLTGEDIEKEAKLIVKHIIEQEQAVLAGLEDIYNSMSDNIFKNMRRLLPVTNQRMNWDQSVLKLIANLNR